MRNILIFLLLSLVSHIAYGNQNFAVNGINEFKKVYFDIFREESNQSNVPVPALFVIDTKSNKILSHREVKELLNKHITTKEQKLNSLPKYLSHDLNSSEVQLQGNLKNNKRYVILFNNPEDYLINMMEKMLNVKMREDLTIITSALLKIDALIVYNKNGFLGGKL